MSGDSEKTAEGKDTAYEYLCRLEEAKKWIEVVIGTELPPATELESALQNGVVLCRLGMKLLPHDPMWSKVYDLEQIKFKSKGLDYRYTDNINFWLISLHKLGLPKIFYPVLTDIYQMKNIPKLIYCIHALSHLLKRQGKTKSAVEDLYGQAEFSPDVISRTSQTIRPSDMPAFSVVDNLVEEELQYQSIGLTDSFDERESVSGASPLHGHVANGGGGGEEEGEEEDGRDRSGEIRDVDLFDDPKYVSTAWITDTMKKLQPNGSSESRHPFAVTTCQVRDIAVHLHTKKPRTKKSPSLVDQTLEKINKAMDEENTKLTLQLLQSKDAKLPFVYADNSDKYWTALRRERKFGLPSNILVVYSGMTREKCLEFLEIMDPGAYIVRTSISMKNTFVFSFRNQTGIKHWQLSDRDGIYYWGNSDGYHTLESFVAHFAEALSHVTKLYVYPGMTSALQPDITTSEQQSMIGRLRAMDDKLTFGHFCHVIKEVNSGIRQDRKVSVGNRPTPRKRNLPKTKDWDSTMIVAVNRLEAEQILNKDGSPGSFLVRPSEKTPGDYALAFRTSTEVRHWKMVQDGGKFYVHPRPNPYNTLEEIIEHFREAVGQETGLVMTPLNWTRSVPKSPDIVITSSNKMSTGTGSKDQLQATVLAATGPSSSGHSTFPSRAPTSPSRSSHNGSSKSSTLGRTLQPSASMSPLNPANLTSWSVDDVSQWLIQKDLGQFLEIFRENLVDGECLMALDNTLLKEDLGITALGHRSRIMKRVRELKASFEPQLTF